MSPEFLSAIKEYGIIGGGLMFILLMLVRRQWSPKWYTDELQQRLRDTEQRCAALEAKLEAKEKALREMSSIALEATEEAEKSTSTQKAIIQKVRRRPPSGGND